MECAVKERSAGMKGPKQYVIVAEGRVCAGLLSVLCTYVRSSGRAYSYSPHCPIFCSPPFLLFPSHVITTLLFVLFKRAGYTQLAPSMIPLLCMIHAQGYVIACFLIIKLWIYKYIFKNVCPWLCCFTCQEDIMPKCTSNIGLCLLVVL